MREIEYIREPTDLQCGQAVLAMTAGCTVKETVEFLHNDRETNLKEMKAFLASKGISLAPERKEAFSVSDLPPFCILSLETPRCWHWSLFKDGVFYDPEHGVMDGFPVSERKFYWEIRLADNNTD